MADPPRPDALDENAVEAAHDAWQEAVGWRANRHELKSVLRPAIAAYIAHADLVPKAELRAYTHVCMDCGALGYAGGYHDHGGGNAGDTIALAQLPEAVRSLQVFEQEADELRAELDRAVRERDEARRSLKAWKRRPSLQAAEESLAIANVQIGEAEERAERAEATVANLREALEEILSEPVPLDARLVRTLAREALNDERRPGE